MLAALLGLFVLVLAGVLVFLVIASGTGGGPHATATPRPGGTSPPDATPAATQFPAPQLAGLTLEAARGAAAEAHLRLVINPVVSDQPIDTVLSQDPAAGALVLPGSTVLIDGRQAQRHGHRARPAQRDRRRRGAGAHGCRD